MTLRQSSIIAVTLVSLASAAVFSGSLLYLARSTMNLWESRKVERGIEIAVAGARDPAEQAEAIQAFRAYRQLQAVKGLIEQRIIIAGLGFGLAVFLFSFAVSSIALTRITRPLKELTQAINQAGAGDLDVKVNAHAQSEVGSVASAFNAMTERVRRSRENLRQAERLAAWRDVARLLSHELRNPLTPIRLSIERLQQRTRSPDLPELVQKSSGTILEEISALERIVGEFSDFARMPAPKLRQANLNQLVADVLRQYAPAGGGAELEIRLDQAGDHWSFDPDLMRRAIANLVKNSVEALADRPGRISVASRYEGRCLRITFADNGPGIPAEIRARLFEPYVTTKAKGTGLGLAFVRQVIAGHRGSVALASESGIGTTIVITIPEGEECESQTAGS
jgi:nitrogen fixation/metabolism regulation signal transduction histidine kinase